MQTHRFRVEDGTPSPSDRPSCSAMPLTEDGDTMAPAIDCSNSISKDAVEDSLDVAKPASQTEEDEVERKFTERGVCRK
ncbi:hypothetical protein K523DRAFT_21940 [Schizophyllum commune Tattone D]|nr:hypothetical protein K523DRAFT_21940 [Schizophyllum commune Tattone D]